MEVINNAEKIDYDAMAKECLKKALKSSGELENS